MLDIWESEGGREARKPSIHDLPGRRYNKTKYVRPSVYDKGVAVEAPKVVLTCAQIRAAENKHNTSVKKRMYHSMPVFPVVFFGLNTA